MTAIRKRGWNDIHQAHRFDREVAVLTLDGRTFIGPVTMICDHSFEVQANGMRTTFYWEGVVADVEVLDRETLAAQALLAAPSVPECASPSHSAESPFGV